MKIDSWNSIRTVSSDAVYVVNGCNTLYQHLKAESFQQEKEREDRKGNRIVLFLYDQT